MQLLSQKSKLIKKLNLSLADIIILYLSQVNLLILYVCMWIIKYLLWLFVDDGEAYIFGDNENQRLGVSETVAKVCKPTLISVGMPIMKAYCGHYHTFFLSESCKLFAVGSNEHGQLGLPRTVTEVNNPTEVNFDKLFDDHSIESMSCGATHTAFVTGNKYYIIFLCLL